MSRPPVVVLGPTASGKSDVAMAVALAAGGTHIVACDAMQVYRGMDIGTAKPTAADRAAVPHHGLDLCGPPERYTVARYVEDIESARRAIAEAGARELVVGGTGLYLTAIVDGLAMPGEWPEVREALEADPDTAGMHARLAGLDPAAAARIEPTNRRRIVRALEVCIGSGRPFSSLGEGGAAHPYIGAVLVVIWGQRVALRGRIARRVRLMVEAGLVEEVRGLVSAPGGLSSTAAQALGYKEIIDHLEGRTSLEEAVQEVILRTQQFAVRQERWFRRDPRITWVDVEDDPVAKVAPVVLAALS